MTCSRLPCESPGTVRLLLSIALVIELVLVALVSLWTMPAAGVVVEAASAGEAWRQLRSIGGRGGLPSALARTGRDEIAVADIAQLGSELAACADRYADDDLSIAFAKVDTEDQQELAAGFGIRSIPTLVAFRDQIGIFSQPGALPEEALDDLIGQIKELDMDAVRSEIAQETEAAEAAEELAVDES